MISNGSILAAYEVETKKTTSCCVEKSFPTREALARWFFQPTRGHIKCILDKHIRWICNNY
jgi:hypothetical protein